MSIEVVANECEGPGVALKENGKFKYSSYSNGPVAAYDKFGRKLTKEETEEQYKHLHEGIRQPIICSSYDSSGKKLTTDQAKVRDEADEFFFRHQRKHFEGRDFHGEIRKPKPKLGWFRRLCNWFSGSGTEWKD